MYFFLLFLLFISAEGFIHFIVLLKEVEGLLNKNNVVYG